MSARGSSKSKSPARYNVGDLSKVPVQYRDSVRRLIMRKVDQRVSEEMHNLRMEALAEVEF
jgi:hypothetical protein